MKDCKVVLENLDIFKKQINRNFNLYGVLLAQTDDEVYDAVIKFAEQDTHATRYFIKEDSLSDEILDALSFQFMRYQEQIIWKELKIDNYHKSRNHRPLFSFENQMNFSHLILPLSSKYEYLEHAYTVLGNAMDWHTSGRLLRRLWSKKDDYIYRRLQKGLIEVTPIPEMSLEEYNVLNPSVYPYYDRNIIETMPSNVKKDYLIGCVEVFSIVFAKNYHYYHMSLQDYMNQKTMKSYAKLATRINNQFNLEITIPDYLLEESINS